MTDDEKREADALHGLLERSWEQFNERRRYEVRLSFAVWTALALSIAGSVKLESLPEIPFGRVALVAVVAFVLLLHNTWQAGIRRANHRDHLRVGEYQRRIHELAGGFAYTDAAVTKLKAGEAENRSLFHWSHATQVGFTVFLGLCLILVNWNRFALRASAAVVSPFTVARDSVALETEKLRLHLLRLDSAARVQSAAPRARRP